MLRSMSCDGLTDNGRQIVHFAQQLARVHDHPFTGTRHLLLALIDDDHSQSGQVLTSMGLDICDIRTALAPCVVMGCPATPHSPPLTPRAHDVLTFFAPGQPATAIGYAGPEHLFFAVLAHHDSSAGKALRSFGLDLRAAQQRVLPLLRPWPALGCDHPASRSTSIGPGSRAPANGR
jgi:ATP-dependent Clp protease ATP-binding subunit ClpA